MTEGPTPTDRSTSPAALGLLVLCAAVWVYGVALYPALVRNLPASLAAILGGLRDFDPVTFLLNLRRILSVAALAAVAWAIGDAAIPRSVDESEHRRVSAVALGLGLIATALAALAFLGGFSLLASPVFALMWYAAGLAAALRFWLRYRGAGWHRPRRAADWALAAGWVAAIATVLMMALVPPVEIDELTYHLLVPQHMLRTGGFVEIPGVFHAYLPFAMEMLFGVVMGVAGDIAAHLVHTLFWALTGLFLYGEGRRRGFGAFPCGALSLLFLSTLLVMKTGAAAYVEMAETLYTLLAAFHAFRFFEEKRWPQYALACAYAGLALATKWHGADTVLLVAVTALAAFARNGRERPWAFFGRLAAGGALCLSFLAPMLIRNALWTGNPIYPFADEWFGSGAWAEGGYDSYRLLQAGFFGLHHLVFPWLGAPVLIIAILGAVGGVRVRAVRPYLVAAVGYIALIAVQSPVERFLLPGLALLVPPAMAAANRIDGRRLRRGFAALFLAAALWSVAVAAIEHRDRVAPALNRAFYEEFLAHRLPRYQGLRAVAGLNRPGDRWFVFGVSELYYADFPFVFGDTLSGRVIDYNRARETPDVLRRLRELGVTHVAFDPRVMRRVKKFDERLAAALGLPLGSPTYEGARLAAYGNLLREENLDVLYVDPGKRVVAARLKGAAAD